MEIVNITPSAVEESFKKDEAPNNVIWFGKYKGLTIEDVIGKDPQYITWCVRNIKGFKLTKEQEELLEELASDSYIDEDFLSVMDGFVENK